MKKSVKNATTLSVERFSPEVNLGLSNEEVFLRLQQGLFNKTNKTKSKSILTILKNNLFTFFNLLGLIVTVALICIKAPISNFFFVAIYFANIFIGIIQELRAKKSIDKLSLLSKNLVTVLRNGEKIEIDCQDIVLDDVFFVTNGNQIPTDCKILNGEMEVNESLLTGESIAVKKSVGDYLFAGSFVTAGNATCQADRVGNDNYVETLSSKAKQYKKPQSELMSSLKTIIKIIGLIIVPIATAFMIKSTVLFGVDVATAISRTSTVVIGMIPSGMFLLTSMALAVGVVKLAKHKTLVQDLYSLEMLARVDTICFDKTGTITDGKMTVTEVIDLEKKEQDYTNIISSMLFHLNDSNQTSLALKEYFGTECNYEYSALLPFNSKNKLSAVTFKDQGTFCLGAPEFVLSKKEYLKNENLINDYARRGVRVLVFAKSRKEIIKEKLPDDFTALSLILLSDNIREDAISTVKWFKDNNVAIKVISGDNPITVSEVSKRAGIEGAENYISLEGLNDKEVYDIANKYTVFGRVTPEQKAILIKALKEAGHVTAMTGDGVNDILALKEANCAISVATGSDAARSVANLVLMDDNFNSMPKVVYEGRRVINNVQSSASLFLMKTLFTMLFALIVLIIPSMSAYPFVLSNMILFEVLVIGMPSFFLSLQENDSLVEGKFIKKVLIKSVPSALLMTFSVGLVLIIKAILNDNIDDSVYTSLCVFVLNFVGLLSLYSICKPFNKFRVVLFSTMALIMLIITLIAMFVGLSSLLQLSVMLPLEKYWLHLVILISVMIIDVPLHLLLQKGFSKIKALN